MEPESKYFEGLKKLLNFMKIKKNKPLVSVIMNCRNGEKNISNKASGVSLIKAI